MALSRSPTRPYDEVREAARALRQRGSARRARLLLLLNGISDRVAAEAHLTEEESIEFSSDITIILSLVYKHTFKMQREYHPFENPTAEHRTSAVLGGKPDRGVNV